MANEYTTYDVVGAKEDISDIINDISPTDYPFQTMIGSEKVHNTLFQWQEDALRASAANAQVEGFTATAVARTPTTMRNNVTQIMQDTFSVAGTTDAVSMYGRAKESAYQAGMAAKALKGDLEYAFVGAVQAAVTPADNSSARKMASALSQVAAGHIVSTGGAGTAPTEANLLTALQDCYDDGANPNTIMCTSDDSLVFADFAKASGRQRNFDTGTKIVNVVDVYVSPFGQQKIVLNRELAATDTLIFDPRMWSKVTLRPWTRETLAKTGDALTMMIVGEFSLKHKNQKASAIIRKQA